MYACLTQPLTPPPYTIQTALLRHWPHHPAGAPLPLAPKDLLFLRFRPPPSTPSLVLFAVPDDERVAGRYYLRVHAFIYVFDMMRYKYSIPTLTIEKITDVALPSPALVNAGPIPPKSASACAHLLLAFNPPPCVVLYMFMCMMMR